MAVSGLGLNASPFTPPLALPENSMNPGGNPLAAISEPPADQFQATATKPLVDDLGTLSPPEAPKVAPTPALSTLSPFMPTMASPQAGASPFSATPQVVYVPVFQSPPVMGENKPATNTESKPTMRASQEVETPLSLVNDTVGSPVLKEPLDPDAPATPQSVGAKLGTAIEQLLERNPEVVDDIDRLNLDEPDLFLGKLHDSIYPVAKLLPDAMLGKAVAQMPVEWQATADRLVDWFKTPPGQLQSLTSPGSTMKPRAMSSVDRPRRELREPIDRPSRGEHRPGSGRSTHAKDPFEELLLDEPAAESSKEKKGLVSTVIGKANPLNQFPLNLLKGKEKKESLNFDDFMV